MQVRGSNSLMFGGDWERDMFAPVTCRPVMAATWLATPTAGAGCWRSMLSCSSLDSSRGKGNLFIYQARESSLVPAGFLTAQFLQ